VPVLRLLLSRNAFRSCLVVGVALACACDPVAGSGSGTAQNPAQFFSTQPAQRTATLTLQPGYPASDLQSNFNGYQDGMLVITVPKGWTLSVDCINRGTVPNSCAIVRGPSDTRPLDPGWATPDPQRGLAPGTSASFSATLAATGSFRFANLVPGRESAGAWALLQVTAGGRPGVAVNT
jgi:hypothetical protein